MIYGIVGAPGTGKEVIAERLSDHLDIPASSGQFPGQEVLLGLQADYRTELSIAAGRAIWQQLYAAEGRDFIFWHTLIDSLAYSYVRFTAMHLSDSVSDMTYGRWGMVCTSVAMMAEDSRWPDLFLYIPYRGDDDNSKRIDASLVDALRVYEQKYTCIDPRETPKTWLTS